MVLVVEELLDGWKASETIAGLRTKLAAIPEDLDEFFGRMLRRIPKSQFPETVAVFKCVLAALRPLTLKELRVALEFGSDHGFESVAEINLSDEVVHGDDGLERRIQSCCGGLVEITKESLVVQCIHQTVLDYLFAPDRLQSLLSHESTFTPARCHQVLLQACIRYFSVPEIKTLPVQFEDFFGAKEIFDPGDGFEFLSYSVSNWVDHYIGAEKNGNSQSSKIQGFARPENNHFFTWYRIYCQSFANGWDRTFPPFSSFAAEHGLFGYVEDFIKRYPISSTDEGEFGGPLQAATISGNLEMVRLLLDHGVDINTQGGRFGTAMAAAITFQNHRMIKLLGECGADIHLQAPGSPLLAYGPDTGWAGHRNPFSRSRQRINRHLFQTPNSDALRVLSGEQFNKDPPQPELGVPIWAEMASEVPSEQQAQDQAESMPRELFDERSETASEDFCQEEDPNRSDFIIFPRHLKDN